MIDVLFLINIIIGLTGVAICLLSMIQILIGTDVRTEIEKYFLLFFGCLACYALSNLVGFILRGTPGQAARIVLYLSNFGEFTFPCALAYILTVYLLSRVDPEHERKALRRMMLLLVIIHVLMLVISQFTGLYYTIDEMNVYHRSQLYPISYVMTLIIIATDVFILITERDKISAREETAFWIILVIPCLSVGIQIFFYGIYFVVFATIISAFIMYIFILRDMKERNRRQLAEISQLKTNILISQVQPHFIFNSLTAIRSLCDMDSEAYEAIGHFAGFIRGSMELLNEKSCIPMTTEIETVDNYLYMEKLRFEDKLEIIRDFRDTSFMLPSCSMQVLAENAVKHGIRKTSEGKGTLIMRSYSSGDSHIIEVEDNGTGFDPEKITSGTGINNVRRRLEIMCNGQLNIKSEPGKGTLAQIIIPNTLVK
ncbi:MAG: histidine kinase [Mogibacterium sp.]|nr:histidine kinase [Mogibacterium sp.]